MSIEYDATLYDLTQFHTTAQFLTTDQKVIGSTPIGCAKPPPRLRQSKMSRLEVKIPDLLFKQVNEVAAKEKVSVDQIVSIALAAQVSASQARESISSRAKRVDWRKVDDILDRVPANPPLSGEEAD